MISDEDIKKIIDGVLIGIEGINTNKWSNGYAAGVRETTKTICENVISKTDPKGFAMSELQRLEDYK